MYKKTTSYAFPDTEYAVCLFLSKTLTMLSLSDSLEID